MKKILWATICLFFINNLMAQPGKRPLNIPKEKIIRDTIGKGRWNPKGNISPVDIVAVPQPHSEDADIDYGPLPIYLGDYTPAWMRDNWVDMDAGDVSIVNAKANIDHICPQHRSVGETMALDKPLKSYQVLEGIVKSSGVAYMDFPSSHYTHDFDFDVLPDPGYHFLLADSLRDGGNGVRDDVQKEIEVEWETGLGQNNVLDGVANPATAYNAYGNSFGFFSAGHTLKDVLWNWPADGDRVHVEGIWTWERGHRPAHTEIHPPHFIATQRKLPVSFILDVNKNPVIRNQADDSYIGTRVDVFASGDGNPMFNTKGLNPSFNQVTDMNRKDYSFIIKHPFARVIPQGAMAGTHSVSLRCRFIKQKGDNFPVDPIISIMPGNDVQVTIPWQTNNVSNNAVFARTFLVYWEDLPIAIGAGTTKVLETEKPKLYQVELVKLNLIRKMDDDAGYGDLRIYCNVGSSWIFLNEFTDNPEGANILQTGLGKAGNTNSFSVNKVFSVYVPATPARSNNNIIYDNLQIKALGWEADGVDIFMGHIINEYSRDKEVVNKFFGEHLNYLDNNRREDDEIGSINKLMNPFTIAQENNTGLQTLHAVFTTKKNEAQAIFDIVYRIREIPFSATLNNSLPTVN